MVNLNASTGATRLDILLMNCLVWEPETPPFIHLAEVLLTQCKILFFIKLCMILAFLCDERLRSLSSVFTLIYPCTSPMSLHDSYPYLSSGENKTGMFSSWVRLELRSI